MGLFVKLNSRRMHSVSFVSGFAGDNLLCPEVLFNQILSWEQKRSKRSNRPFMLMLLDIQEQVANKNGSDHSLKDKLARALYNSTRDIDQRGWYVQDQVMGVIFSELSDQDINHASELVWRRVQFGLHQTINPQELRQVDVSLHMFPEGCDSNGRCVWPKA
jgi:hypothetical protein